MNNVEHISMLSESFYGYFQVLEQNEALKFILNYRIRTLHDRIKS